MYNKDMRSRDRLIIQTNFAKQMNLTNDEKDVLFLSLNNIIKDYEVWNRLETNSQFNIRYKLLDILKDYGEEYIWTAVFIIKPIVQSQYGQQFLKEAN